MKLKIVDNTHFDKHCFSYGDIVVVHPTITEMVFDSRDKRFHVKRLSDKKQQWITLDDVILVNNSIQKIT